MKNILSFFSLVLVFTPIQAMESIQMLDVTEQKFSKASPTQLCTYLLEASSQGETEEVKALLKLETNTHTTDSDGNTPLHLAIINNQEDNSISPVFTFISSLK